MGVANGEWRVGSGEWGVVIASGSDAIQLVVQEEAGLPRRFAPRNDGVETRSFAMTVGADVRSR